MMSQVFSLSAATDCGALPEGQRIDTFHTPAKLDPTMSPPGASRQTLLRRFPFRLGVMQNMQDASRGLHEHVTGLGGRTLAITDGTSLLHSVEFRHSGHPEKERRPKYANEPASDIKKSVGKVSHGLQ